MAGPFRMPLDSHPEGMPGVADALDHPVLRGGDHLEGPGVGDRLSVVAVDGAASQFTRDLVRGATPVKVG